MKNFYKRILIMFVMVLTIMSVGIIKNEMVANAATVGEQLLQSEEGWRRYDDSDNMIMYAGSRWNTYNSSYLYSGSTHFTGVYGVNPIGKKGEYAQFEMKSTKLRIIAYATTMNEWSSDVIVLIDGIEVAHYTQVLTTGGAQMLLYEITGLSDSVHNIKLINNTNVQMGLDAIDIDKTGYLVDPNSPVSSISLDKSSLTIEENNTKKLTATTTPSAVGVEWSSSDEAVATVDQNGNVTGIKEGTCIVTVQIKGTGVKATCEVTVTKEDIVEPEEPSGNGSLYIEMVDGNIKQAQNLNTSDFIKWYQNRDLDKTEKPFYKITNAKGNVEYLIHDKIVAFEIR
ncbi:Ig-like domain-containing protein [Clostridium butyricum]|uniref:Ig-like domain-containing protein n=1 Tax=Clostridium butyricum TaxID=1492 RepID=UPI0032BF3A8C